MTITRPTDAALIASIRKLTPAEYGEPLIDAIERGRDPFGMFFAVGTDASIALAILFDAARASVPELPPSYRVTEHEGGWIAGDGDCWFDDGDYGETFDTRDEAAEAAWRHWYDYVADEGWTAFVDSGRAHQADGSD